MILDEIVKTPIREMTKDFLNQDVAIIEVNGPDFVSFHVGKLVYFYKYFNNKRVQLHLRFAFLDKDFSYFEKDTHETYIALLADLPDLNLE